MHIKTWESSLLQISLLLADLSFKSLADLYAKYVGLSDDSPWIDNDLFDLENNQTYYCYSYMKWPSEFEYMRITHVSACVN